MSKKKGKKSAVRLYLPFPDKQLSAAMSLLSMLSLQLMKCAGATSTSLKGQTIVSQVLPGAAEEEGRCPGPGRSPRACVLRQCLGIPFIALAAIPMGALPLCLKPESLRRAWRIFKNLISLGDLDFSISGLART